MAGSKRIPQYPMTKAIAGPHVISRTKCFITGGIKNSAAIQPTIKAKATSFSALILNCFFVKILAPAPQPDAKMQQNLAPKVCIKYSILFSPLTLNKLIVQPVGLTKYLIICHAINHTRSIRNRWIIKKLRCVRNCFSFKQPSIISNHPHGD